MEKETNRLLQEILDWIRVSNYNAVKAVLLDVFGTEAEPRHQQRAAYDMMSDGLTQTEIGQTLGIHQTTVSTWAATWKRLGIARSDNTTVFKLSDFGLKVQRPSRPKGIEVKHSTETKKEEGGNE